MKEFNKVLRLLIITMMIILASFGIGIVGNLFSNSREWYRDNEIKTEQVDKRDEDESEEEDKT